MIYNEDSLVEIKQFNNTFDLAIIDMPYKTTFAEWDVSWNNECLIESQFIKHLHDAMTAESSIYVCCGMGERSQSLIEWFPLFSEYFHFKDIITWKKSRGNGNRKGWLYTREELLWFVKDNKKFRWNKKYQYSNERRKRDGNSSKIRPSNGQYKCQSEYKRLTNVWTDITEQGTDVLGVKFHYTPKPLKLIERLVLLHTTPSSIVLDPFAGSGSTEIVCNKFGLDSISYEINKEIYQQAKQRIESC